MDDSDQDYEYDSSDRYGRGHASDDSEYSHRGMRHDVIDQHNISNTDQSVDGSGDEDENKNDAADAQAVSFPTIQMCPVHKPGQMVETCDSCNTVFCMVRPEIAKQLSGAVAVESVASRYAGRSDEKSPSMILTEATLQLAVRMFTQGRFNGKNVFKDLIAKYASLPLAQHDQLVQDLVLEPFFKKVESDRRFKHLFSLRQAMGENHKQLRLCQRPLFQVISELDASLAKVNPTGRIPKYPNHCLTILLLILMHLQFFLRQVCPQFWME